MSEEKNYTGQTSLADEAAPEEDQQKTYRAEMKRKYRRISLILVAVIAVSIAVLLTRLIDGDSEKVFAWHGQDHHPSLLVDNALTMAIRSDGTVLAQGTYSYRVETTANGARYSRAEFDLSGWSQIVSLKASDGHVVGLRRDGTVLAQGDNYWGACNVSEWTNITAISVANANTIALCADGTVLATGYNHDQQCNVSGWTDVVQVEAMASATVGLRSDGSILMAGTFGSNTVDNQVRNWRDVTSFSSSQHTVIALLNDGTALVASNEHYGYGLPDVSNWCDLVAVWAGRDVVVGLKSDGTLLASEIPTQGNRDNRPSHGGYDISDWNHITAVVVDNNNDSAVYPQDRGGIAALCSDGTVLSTNFNTKSWRDIQEIALCGNHIVGLKSDGTLVVEGSCEAGLDMVYGWTGINASN